MKHLYLKLLIVAALFYPKVAFAQMPVGYCPANGTYNYMGEIMNVTTGNINNTSGMATLPYPGYTDYTRFSASFQKGTSASVTITAAKHISSTHYKVYIDYNRDGDFLDAGELVYLNTTSLTTVTGFFTVPLCAISGITRMRVMHSIYAFNTPCGNIGNNAEVEDYTINLTGPDPISPAVVSICEAGKIKMSVSNPVAGVSYRWYTAVTGGTLVNTGTTYSPAITATTTYYVEAVNSIGCVTPIRTAVTATANSCCPVAGDFTITGPGTYGGGPLRLTVRNNTSTLRQVTITLNNGTNSFTTTTPSVGFYNIAPGASTPFSFNGSFPVTTLSTVNQSVTITTGGCSITYMMDVKTSNYCTASGTYNYMGEITNVNIGSINNTSGVPVLPYLGYFDYTQYSTNLQQGASASISITVAKYMPNSYFKVYIDYNMDGDFLDVGELVYANTSTLNTVKGTFTVPSCLTSGPTRMRVMHSLYAFNDPCGNIGNNGEVEDYTINLTGPDPISPAVVSICEAGKIKMSVSNPVAGVSYRWYTAVTGGMLVNTGTTYSPAITATITYYVEAINSIGCTTPIRTAVTATIDPICCPIASDFMVNSLAYYYIGSNEPLPIYVTNKTTTPQNVTVTLNNGPESFVSLTPSQGPFTIQPGVQETFNFSGVFSVVGYTEVDQSVTITTESCSVTYILKIIVSSPLGFSSVSISPNPFINEARLLVQSSYEEQGSYIITGLQGNIMVRGDFTTNVGKLIPLVNFPIGVYILSVYSQHTEKTITIIKNK